MLSKRKRAKPVTGWTIKKDGVLWPWMGTLGHLRRAPAIRQWTVNTGKTWPYRYRHDWRCVRVTVQEATR